MTFDPFAVAADAEVRALPAPARRVYQALLLASTKRAARAVYRSDRLAAAARALGIEADAVVPALLAAGLLCDESGDGSTYDVLTPERRDGARLFDAIANGGR